MDTELEAALHTLRRVPRVPAGTLAWIRELQREGYRFAFADLDLLTAAARRQELRRALERPDSLRRALRGRLDAVPHAERRTTDLAEGPESLYGLSRADLVRIDLLLRSLARRGVRSRIAAWIARPGGTASRRAA